jgi:uncharacterized protein with FMN-binding domain
VSDSSSHKKVANSLLALSSAAVLAVYTAGYLRTKSAADRFTVQAAARRPLPLPSAPPVRVEPPPIASPEIVAAPAPALTKSAINGPLQRPAQRHLRDRSARSKKLITPPRVNTTDSEAPAALPLGPSLSVPEVAPSRVEQAPVAATLVPPPPAKSQYKDGTYYGWGTSRHGDIQAAVVVQDGRIASATIAQCLTRYSCSVIAKLPPQVAERQSPETDYVSGATQSTNAFYYAVVEALAKAK